MRKVWPWEDPEEVELSNGIVVLAVTVPPYAYIDVHAKAPPPPTPVVELQSKYTPGSAEKVKPLPESEEWQAYWQARRLYDVELRARTGMFRLDYGTLGWHYPGTPEDEWHDAPPEGWEPPAVLARWQVDTQMYDTPELLRCAFIKYVLIRTEADEKALSDIWDGQRVPTKREVSAAEAPFE